MLKLSNYIENAPYLRERSSLAVQCIKTPIGYFFEEGSALKFLNNNDAVITIDDMVMCWAILPDCKVIFTSGMLGCENNEFTILSPGKEKDNKVYGNVGRDGALYYMENGMLVRRDTNDELKVLLCLKNATGVSAYEDMLAVDYNYKDTTFSSVLFYDYDGQKKNTVSQKRFLFDVYNQITHCLIDPVKFEKLSDENAITKDGTLRALIDDLCDPSLKNVTRNGVNCIIDKLKEFDLLHRGSVSMYRKLEAIIDEIGVNDEFQDIIINIMDYCSVRRYAGRQIGRLITNPVYERIRDLTKKYDNEQMKLVLSNRGSLIKAIDENNV